ncbi:Gfo/Idh/MocA family oxidoreductase [Fusibacter bizertensis]|uniref:Gfo/Idh/MocA family oxidoreductase n=1 Tax=Fusibacter bizertensis TaxID=1488331 RepID=A0ABT6N8N4_9FIRM|nr:Gfo/Idh/MocA family oxidoreductase [Fusibacter bizertensis]MDH8676768.1 Gfo/Idh/MocA family oxidoreductase [Fusibacter bizertensis]
MIKWGIYGAGTIADKYAHDFSVVKGGQIIAVYARDGIKVKSFCENHKIDKAYSDENEFFNDPEIDVVYVATPHTLHAKVAMKALNAGKHVVCEKPFAMNFKEAKEVIELAQRKELFVMEALWTLFLPTIQEVKRKITTGTIGNLQKIKCSFGFKNEGPSEGRLLNPSLGGGALLDIGIYTVMITNYLMGVNYKEMHTDALYTDTGVDGTVNIRLLYNQHVEVELNASILENLDNNLLLIGDAGTIEVPQFWEANHALIIKEVETHKIEHIVTGFWGYHYEIEHICQMITEGKIESDIASHKFTLELMQELDKIRDQIGLKYKADNII